MTDKEMIAELLEVLRDICADAQEDTNAPYHFISSGLIATAIAVITKAEGRS